MGVIRKQTYLEEVINSSIHFIGMGLSIAGLCILLLSSNSVWEKVSFAIYGSTLILLYFVSTLYHSFSWSRMKCLFKIIDHSAIYLLIAGTYTPFLLISLRGGWGWSLFGVIWGLATLGILFKIFCVNKLRILSTIFYLLMGWLILIAINPLINVISSASLFWLIIGGITYSLGVIFFAKDNIPHFHNVWHLFVIGGSISHFFSILLI